MTDVAPQWEPTSQDIADARVTDFARFVRRRIGAPMPDYQSLWQWSVDDPAAFWGALWEYFELGVKDLAQAEAEYPGWLSRLLTHPVRGLESYQELFAKLTNPNGAIKVFCEVADL